MSTSCRGQVGRHAEGHRIGRCNSHRVYQQADLQIVQNLHVVKQRMETTRLGHPSIV
jgi:hypothetical protein